MKVLTNPTTDQLDQAIVEHVSHWTPTKQQLDANRSWAEITGGDTSDAAVLAVASYVDRPRYSTSVDAILPWFAKRNWHSWNQGGKIFVGVYPERGERNFAPKWADNLARAMVFELLSVRGVEVEFT